MSIGLVFAGGGGKGSYQIGVWKALRELGLDEKITAVAGTSVGALNAALFAQGNIELAENAWKTLSPEKIYFADNFADKQKTKKYIAKEIAKFLGLTFAPHLFMVPLIRAIASPIVIETIVRGGIVSNTGLSKMIETAIDFSCVSSWRIPCWAACAHIALKFPVEYFRLGDDPDVDPSKILLASAAIPGFFPPVPIQKHKYWDGGLSDNIPISPILENTDCSTILAVHLDHKGKPTDMSKYADATIIDIIPKEDLGGLKDGTLDFSPAGVDKRISLGYQDAMSLISSIPGVI